jgi:multiple sugar transport system substrate-binding protein
VFWTLGIGSGSRHKQQAYDFLHFVTQPELDKKMTRHVTFCVRLSTWRDPEVQKNAPIYSKIEEISLGARTLPRSRNLPAFAACVDDVVTTALTTARPSAEILRDAQRRISRERITFQ